MEINSNPSFNMNINKFEKIDGGYKYKSEVSEVDKHIKSLVVADAFKTLMFDDNESLENVQFEKIFDKKTS